MITLTNQPNTIHSAGNDNWYSFTSNLDFFPEFQMSASIIDGSSILNTVSLPINPDGLSILNIKNIVNDWVSVDFNPYITSATSSTAYRNYTINVAETFAGLFIKGVSVANRLPTVDVVNNTTVSSLDITSSISLIDFLGGTVSQPYYVYGYTTASNSYIDSIQLTSVPGTYSAPIAYIATYSSGYMILEQQTVYSIGNTYSTSIKTALKGSIDYLDYNSQNNYSEYIAGTSSAKFLTNAPSVLQIQPDELSTLTYINGTSSQPFLLEVIDNLGATYSKSLSGFTSSALVEVPTGTTNLNINPSADSYCVSLVSNAMVATYSTIEILMTDYLGTWAVPDIQTIEFTDADTNSWMFRIFGDPTVYPDPEGLYNGGVVYSYNEVSNSVFKSNWDIVFTGDSSNLIFKIVSKNTGAGYDKVSDSITSSTLITYLTGSTSGRDVAVPFQSSETKCYEISCLNRRWEPIRLCWLNSLGAIDYYTFKYINNASKRIKRDNFDKNLNYSYNRETRGITTYRLEDYNQYTVVSDPLGDDESTWLSELMTSQEVAWLRGSEIIPVTIIGEQYDYNVGLDNQQLSVTFRLSRTNVK